MSKELKARIERAQSINELLDLALVINREGLAMPEEEFDALCGEWNRKYTALSTATKSEIQKKMPPKTEAIVEVINILAKHGFKHRDVDDIFVDLRKSLQAMAGGNAIHKV